MTSNRPSPVAKQWAGIAQKLWNQGKRHEAIQTLIDGINQNRTTLPRMPCLLLAFYFFQINNFSAAETVLSQYLKQNPEDYEALENRGVMRSRMGNRQGAYEDFQQVVTHSPESVNAWDGFTAVLSRLRRYEEASQAGAQVLALKNKQCKEGNAVNISWPNISPQDWDIQNQHRNDIIAFSLWGDNPVYLRGAVRNLLEAPRLYAGWTCRFYIDNSVPDEFKTLAQSLGGELLEEQAGQSQRQKLAWRFQVVSDPTVRRFLIRDADSVISEREVHAVQEWLESDRWFHVMRDWWTHTDLILAGMWGGRAGLLENLQPRIRDYQPGRLETANVDQWFLRDCVWPAIRNTQQSCDRCLIHDRYFRALGASPWPDPAPEGNSHVGQDEAAVKAALQTEALGALVKQYDWLQLRP